VIYPDRGLGDGGGHAVRTRERVFWFTKAAERCLPRYQDGAPGRSGAQPSATATTKPRPQDKRSLDNWHQSGTRRLDTEPEWCQNGAMDLRVYVDNIHRQLAIAAEAGGDEARALAERLIAPLDAAIRLTLQDVLSAAADEITRELAPGSVELRLRGRDPEFVVAPPPVDRSDDELFEDDRAAGRSSRPVAARATPSASLEGDADAMSRINLRMSDQLKARIEEAADREGLSVNNWLVRAATAAVERNDSGRREQPTPHGAQRYTGWVR
jgi:predicted HicB family RNase H-like nuclease